MAFMLYNLASSLLSITYVLLWCIIMGEGVKGCEGQMTNFPLGKGGRPDFYKKLSFALHTPPPPPHLITNHNLYLNTNYKL